MDRVLSVRHASGFGCASGWPSLSAPSCRRAGIYHANRLTVKVRGLTFFVISFLSFLSFRTFDRAITAGPQQVAVLAGTAGLCNAAGEMERPVHIDGVTRNSASLQVGGWELLFSYGDPVAVFDGNTCFAFPVTRRSERDHVMKWAYGKIVVPCDVPQFRSKLLEFFAHCADALPVLLLAAPEAEGPATA